MKRMQRIQKLLFYMNGRYGYDELSKFLLVVGLLFGVLSNFFFWYILSVLGIALVAFGVLRVLSKEKTNRLKELRTYLKLKNNLITRYVKLKNRWVQRKVYKVTTCPECKQKVRVPRKNKKIRITCPSCKTKFVKKT